MKTQISNLRHCGAVSLAFAIAALVFSSADAAHIEYGDFSGTSVMYIDVQEVANSPGDASPLFGPPSITGNELDFDPATFTAVSTNGVSDLTDGQLNFTLMSLAGSFLDSITIDEGGDYSLLGTGTSATQVSYGLSLASVVVLEVDGVALATPVVLAGASAFGTADLGSGQTSNTLWDLSLVYDVDAALTDAGVDFVNGATKLEIAIDNTLSAISEQASIATIAKKDFRIDVNTEVPEPSTIMLLGLAIGGVGLLRRRSS